MISPLSPIQFDSVTREIGQITLNQPRRRNALTAAMWDLLVDALHEAAQAPHLRVLIITGAEAHFAAGADISEFSSLYATPESSADISQKISVALEAVANFPQPTLAKIRGACVGGGAGIALACDIRFADSTSKFAVTPAKLGLVYPFADVRRLTQTVGMARAKDILFSARLILASEAKDMGLVDRLVAPDGLDDAVHDYALSLCAVSKNSVAVTKQMFAAIAQGQNCETCETQQWFLDAFASDDFKEGNAAFLEKRKPKF